MRAQFPEEYADSLIHDPCDNKLGGKLRRLVTEELAWGNKLLLCKKFLTLVYKA
jgi:hypothetical protein